MAEVPSFWGLILKSGSSVDPEIPEGRFLTLSQVSLHAPNQGRVTLFCETNGTKYVLCNLEWDRVEQVALNLQFFSEDEIKFSTTGKGEIHLIGHLGVEAPLYDSEDDLDEDEFREAMRHKGFAFDEEIDSEEGDSDEEGDYSPKLQVNGKKLLPPTKDVSKEKSKKEKAAQPQKGAKQSAKQEKAEKPKKEKKPKNAEQAPKKAEKAEQTPKKAEQTPKKAEQTPKKAEKTPKKAEEQPKVAEQTPKKKDKTPKKRPAEGTPEGKEDGKKAKTEGAFTCVECSRGFVAESGLAAHQKAKHTPK